MFLRVFPTLSPLLFLKINCNRVFAHWNKREEQQKVQTDRENVEEWALVLWNKMKKLEPKNQVQHKTSGTHNTRKKLGPSSQLNFNYWENKLKIPKRSSQTLNGCAEGHRGKHNVPPPQLCSLLRPSKQYLCSSVGTLNRTTRRFTRVVTSLTHYTQSLSLKLNVKYATCMSVLLCDGTFSLQATEPFLSRNQLKLKAPKVCDLPT